MRKIDLIKIKIEEDGQETLKEFIPRGKKAEGFFNKLAEKYR